MTTEANDWCVYMLRCADGTLYTGMTNRLEVRVALHSAGKGAKYTRSRRPVELVWSVDQPDRGTALRTEARIKKCSRNRKLELVEGRWNL